VPQLTQHDITKLYSQIGKTYEEGGKDGRWKRKSGERERERERERRGEDSLLILP